MNSITVTCFIALIFGHVNKIECNELKFPGISSKRCLKFSTSAFLLHAYEYSYLGSSTFHSQLVACALQFLETFKLNQTNMFSNAYLTCKLKGFDQKAIHLQLILSSHSLLIYLSSSPVENLQLFPPDHIQITTKRLKDVEQKSYLDGTFDSSELA
jgi:hypothetical protein